MWETSYVCGIADEVQCDLEQVLLFLLLKMKIYIPLHREVWEEIDKYLQRTQRTDENPGNFQGIHLREMDTNRFYIKQINICHGLKEEGEHST